MPKRCVLVDAHKPHRKIIRRTADVPLTKWVRCWQV